MANSKYNDLKKEYGLTDGEIENVQIGFAAILNNYLVTRKDKIGNDNIYSYFKIGSDTKFIYSYQDNRELKAPEKTSVKYQLKLDEEHTLDDNYIINALQGKSPEQIDILLNFARNSLIEKRPENDVRVTKYFHDLITRAKQLAGDQYIEHDQEVEGSR